jgi:ACR3 family arsenite transporter
MQRVLASQVASVAEIEKMKPRLKFLDRFLTLWIFLAMVTGVALGNFFPGLARWIDAMSMGTTNVLLAFGLIIMMYPPLTKVDFSRIPQVMAKPKLLLSSFVVTWLIGPLLMFLLATTFLRDYPEYMTGLIIIGLAPCIAMVIVWNDLAQGSKEWVIGLVGINSLLQVLFFAFYAYFCLEIVLPMMGIPGVHIEITMLQIAQTVGLYLGVPFIAAVISRKLIIANKGAQWFHTRFVPAVSPLTLIALLFTIVVMFVLKGQMIVQLPLDVVRVAVPLVIFFAVMFLLMFFVARLSGANYAENAAVSFTASGNNFELAIAVSIGVFGLNSGQAFAGVIGPLVEVPALILMVKLSLYLKKKIYGI